ncbi:GNAT family N-acetyltransferase [Fluviibacterium sp. DFM31]|uniref:GNAT family N-acetyltransferase n=1 Tax=Meridianimarinicoccus marinus TaxID=3231483 RepID=A0ABV3L504_9RHOB
MAEWRETPFKHPVAEAALQQHPAYGRACRVWGREVRCFVLGDSTAPLATAQVLVRRWPGLGKVALLSRGPIWGAGIPAAVRGAALPDLLAHLRQDHAGLIATPEIGEEGDPFAGLGYLPMMTPAHVVELDLGGGPAAMRARLRGKWRNRLVRAEAAGLEVWQTRMTGDTGHWLLRAEAGQAKARGYRRLPPGFTAAFAAASPGAAQVFTAYLAGERVAGILVLLHAPTASYHMAWSAPQGRAVGAANLLLWRAMQWAAAQGCTRLDLDLVDTETAPGLARFKLGTGATPRALGHTWIDAPGTRLVARLWPGGQRIQMPSGQKA